MRMWKCIPPPKVCKYTIQWGTNTFSRHCNTEQFPVLPLSYTWIRKMKRADFNLGNKLIPGLRLVPLICIHVLHLGHNLMYTLLWLHRAGVRLNLAYIQYSSGTRSWIFDACTYHPAYHIHPNKKLNSHCLQTLCLISSSTVTWQEHICL